MRTLRLVFQTLSLRAWLPTPAAMTCDSQDTDVKCVAQKPRIDAAHHKAREILKVSPLLTDAYFHYTPSQIMLAALSLADRELAERIINNAFTPTQKDGTGPNTATTELPSTASEMKEKVTITIEACRDMLATEPPERMETYWGTVRNDRCYMNTSKKTEADMMYTTARVTKACPTTVTETQEVQRPR